MPRAHPSVPTTSSVPPPWGSIDSMLRVLSTFTLNRFVTRATNATGPVVYEPPPREDVALRAATRATIRMCCYETGQSDIPIESIR
ncbi:hypothetical protein EVAR_6812_1 [Eumeta japonica]|uniref:Uncharacterized protein n=1 Tax=Eumeta variegata TaxID=151549 RepID=A0A4C1U6D5_EUMVA|nr:hypothetical protein EVAR_6812_1 [Eumeta japonica]